mmetsp:Transcript_31191/g.78274  ORF Transcript_31191/g.78274 Transcript_31191/m.78274 type:complete len:259 (+) Transcript_31191:378-1154(+)
MGRRMERTERLPSHCPLKLSPHAYTNPLSRRQHVWFFPASTFTVRWCEKRFTASGAVRFAVSPKPSCPAAFRPHVNIVLSWERATVWWSPASMLTTTHFRATFTACVELLLLPVPSWPCWLLPQLTKLPSAHRAVAKSWPTATDSTLQAGRWSRAKGWRADDVTPRAGACPHAKRQPSSDTAIARSSVPEIRRKDTPLAPSCTGMGRAAKSGPSRKGAPDSFIYTAPQELLWKHLAGPGHASHSSMAGGPTARSRKCA